MKKTIPLFLLLLSIFLAVSIFWNRLPDPETAIPTMKKNGPSTVDHHHLSERYTIPNTSVSFSYPQDGFYGHGITIENWRNGARIFTALKTADEIDPLRAEEYPAMEIEVRPSHLGSLSEIIEAVQHGSPLFEEDALLIWSNEGKYTTLNKRDFYLTSMTEDSNFLYAMTETPDTVLILRLNTSYLDLADEQSRSVILFMDFLSHISL